MTCRHDWFQSGANSRVCALCDATEFDPYPARLISNDQAAALGFARNEPVGLLQAKFWTFPDDVFRRCA